MERYKSIKEKCRKEMEELIKTNEIEFDMKIWVFHVVTIGKRI